MALLVFFNLKFIKTKLDSAVYLDMLSGEAELSTDTMLI